MGTLKDKYKMLVVMLPTTKATRAGQNLMTLDGGNLAIPVVSGEFSHDNFQVHELYFISNREVGQGDFYYDSVDKKVHQNGNTITDISRFRRVECATDNYDMLQRDEEGRLFPIPAIPISFLRKYVESGGMIKEVNVEMIREYDADDEDEMYNYKLHVKTRLVENTCIVSRTDVYEESEVIHLLNKLYEKMNVGSSSEIELLANDFMKKNIAASTINSDKIKMAYMQCANDINAGHGDLEINEWLIEEKAKLQDHKNNMMQIASQQNPK